MAGSPNNSPRRLGCDCKNPSDFEGCDNAAPCCDYCDNGPTAYVVKWGCQIVCGGVALPAYTPVWRKCLVGEDTCLYETRVIPELPVVAPGTSTSEEYECKPLDPDSRRYYGYPAVDARPGFATLVPPVWQEEVDGPYSYKKPPFKGCCYRPGVNGLMDGSQPHKAAWADSYNLCPESAWASFPWPLDWILAPYLLTVLQIEITSTYTAVMRILDIYGNIKAIYYCPDFNCNADENTFHLDESSYDDEGCPGLPCAVCVSRYAKNFKTPCTGAGHACKCCDGGWGQWFVTITGSCVASDPPITLYRYPGDPCNGDLIGPGDGMEILCGVTRDSVDDVGESVCGVFLGVMGMGCTYPAATVLRVWCDGEDWKMDGWCLRASAEDPVTLNCYYLNEEIGPWTAASQECTCYGPLLIFDGSDFGTCCCFNCSESCCPEGNEGPSEISTSLFITFQTSDPDCESGLDGWVVALTSASDLCGEQQWVGSGTPPGGDCEIHFVLNGFGFFTSCKLSLVMTRADGSGSCSLALSTESISCPFTEAVIRWDVNSGNNCYPCVAEDPDDNKPCSVFLHITE